MTYLHFISNYVLNKWKKEVNCMTYNNILNFVLSINFIQFKGDFFYLFEINLLTISNSKSFFFQIMLFVEWFYIRN